MFASEVVLMAITFTIMAITLSSIYASTDSTAGEKERGTLETILTFPIARKELILGKYFSICISGIITMSIGVILSITSLFFVKNNFTIYDNVIFNMTPITIVLTIIILIFYTLFISGLCIAIASFTKTFKEAQSALTPISLITCVPMFLSMLNINLNGILNFIPIVNHTIVINDILTGTINTNNILITIISSTIYIIILISLISKIYKSEKSYLIKVLCKKEFLHCVQCKIPRLTSKTFSDTNSFHKVIYYKISKKSITLFKLPN